MSSAAVGLGDARRARRTSGAASPRTYSADVPARIMLPRMLFLGASVALVLFGLLMIFSASSVLGLTSKATGFNSMYYLIRQAGFALFGALIAAGLARMDYHRWQGTLLIVALAVTVLGLGIVFTPLAGHDAYGASRWIKIGQFTLQPSEFAKLFIVLVGAGLGSEYFSDGLAFDRDHLLSIGGGIVLPLVLVFFQPDKGTTGVIVFALLVMAYIAGVPLKNVAIFCLVVGLVVFAIAMSDGYSRARIMTMFNMSADEFGSGYQINQGHLALGSGGLTGVGLGMSRQKYNYLPMPHNDFIFAVIGEELGFVGCVGMLTAFVVLLWSGLRIAGNAPDVFGRLIAVGCTSLLFVQLLLNVFGVLGLFPLSGKPVPFISYGGSSIIASMALAGMVLSVSLRSKLPETHYDRRRAALHIADDEDELGGGYPPDVYGSRAGEPRPRSARLAMRVIEGGASRRR